MPDDKTPNQPLPHHDPSQAHIQTPHVRSFIPQMTKNPENGTPVAVLVDPQRLHEKQIALPGPAVQVIAQFQGVKTIKELSEQFKMPEEVLVQLAQVLEEHYLLWGPRFSDREAQRKAELNELGVMPKGAAFMMNLDAIGLKEQFEQWLEQAEDPELDEVPRGLVLPHLDYNRGWPLFATGYKALVGSDPPDRVIVLGTNHHGIGDGVTGTDWAWESPFGATVRDEPLMQRLQDQFGDELCIDQLDHVAEHSIQLHLPWIQHVLGDVPISGFLIPDPLVPMIADDGERVLMEDFAQALQDHLQALGGRSLIIASSDLSHVGPQFGEPAAVDEQRRGEIEQHDRDLISKFMQGESSAFIEAMEWCKNPTRWCSIGNMSVFLSLMGSDSTVELLDYRQAYDESEQWMVTAAAFAVE
ncbi:MAG: AmmeMemoRadiSam system protein B [Phycisphaerae bacterium]|nr:AmmeMemoRadiSam system protein B [Phycisphaerae bacterium]